MSDEAVVQEVQEAVQAEPQEEHIKHSKVVKNTTWNLAGRLAPLVVAAVVIPILIRGIGKDRFGILTIVWLLIGYFSLFDFGLGRALEKLVAEKFRTGKKVEIPPLVCTGLAVIMALGMVGALTAALLAPWLANSVLKIPANPPHLRRETVLSLYLLAGALPFVITNTAQMGILEAYQRFDLTNAGRMAVGVYMFLGPALLLPFTHSLVPLVALLAIGRVIVWLVYINTVRRLVVGDGFRFDRSVLGRLITFGGWMTVSNVISPFMVYMDRLFIGALISTTAVAYYATPSEMVTKLTLISSALSSVLFREFAVHHVDRERLEALFDRGLRMLQILLFPVVLTLVALSPEIIRLWLHDPMFVAKSAPVARWLAVGIFVNALAAIPLALVQGIGRPDLTAKLHMTELPVFIGMLLVLLHAYGITGAAFAWAFRMTLDLVLLALVSRKFVLPHSAVYRRLLLTMAILGAILAVPAFLPTTMERLAYVLCAYLVFGIGAWRELLHPAERQAARTRVNALLTRRATAAAGGK